MGMVHRRKIKLGEGTGIREGGVTVLDRSQADTEKARSVGRLGGGEGGGRRCLREHSQGRSLANCRAGRAQGVAGLRGCPPPPGPHSPPNRGRLIGFLQKPAFWNLSPALELTEALQLWHWPLQEP